MMLKTERKRMGKEDPFPQRKMSKDFLSVWRRFDFNTVVFTVNVLGFKRKLMDICMFASYAMLFHVDT
eukprot:c3808_g1_i1 orf=32-235(-)